MFKIGDRVTIKFGDGMIVRMDSTTYSIVIYTVQLVNGLFIGEELSVPEQGMLAAQNPPAGLDVVVIGDNGR